MRTRGACEAKRKWGMCLPGDDTQPSGFFQRYRWIIGTGLGGLFAIFVAISGGQVKKLVEAWFRDCTAVITIDDARINSQRGREVTVVPVEVFVQGNSNVPAVLYFEHPKQRILGVSMVRQASDRVLSFTEDSGKYCPKVTYDGTPQQGAQHCGDFATAPGTSKSKTPTYRKVGWRLTFLHAALRYQFEVEFAEAKETTQHQNLNVYAVLGGKPSDIAAGKFCRFQQESFWNRFVTLSPSWRFFAATFVLIAMSVIAGLFTRLTR